MEGLLRPRLFKCLIFFFMYADTRQVLLITVSRRDLQLTLTSDLRPWVLSADYIHVKFRLESHEKFQYNVSGTV